MSRPFRCAGSVLSTGLVFVWGVFFQPATAGAQSAGPIMVNSISGQFVVTAGPQFSPLLHDPDLITNNNYIRLDPALLAVSAERFRESAWEQLGLKNDAPGNGKIFIALHPAQSPDEAAVISVGPFLKSWSCRVELPDLVTLPHYGRALSAALLLELASRQEADPGHVPEIPAWLADGLAQTILAKDAEKIILSIPFKTKDGLLQSRMDKHERGLTPTAGAMRTLQNSPTLTFDQLCWPNDGQINGQDGGSYLASAQLFTTYLLALPGGQVKMQNFLAALPTCLNWQTAFFEAYQENFKHPLEVEKWWSLCAVRFTARDPGPHWTPAYSRDRLAILVTVPVEYWSSSNSLPLHMEVSLQAAVRGFSPDERDTVLQGKLRDLEMAQFRLAPPFVQLASGYAHTLADFLGEGRKAAPTPLNKHVVNEHRTASADETIQKLDLLDAQRRAAESRVQPDVVPGP